MNFRFLEKILQTSRYGPAVPKKFAFKTATQVAAVFLLSVPSIAFEPITILTSEYFPNIVPDESGQSEAALADIARKVMEDTDTEFTFQYLPPERALREALEGPRKCILVTPKLPRIAGRLHWLGPILKSGLGLFTRQSMIDQDPTLLTEEAMRTRLISARNIEIAEQSLADLSAQRIVLSPTDAEAMRLLKIGRVSYLFTGFTGGPVLARKQGIDDLVRVKDLVYSDYYFACSADIPEEQANLWQEHFPEPYVVQ